MTAPTISALPDAPTRADSPSEFNNKAFALVDSLAQFRTEVNALVAWMNSNVNGSPVSNISGGGSVSSTSSGGYIRGGGTTNAINVPPDSDESMSGLVSGSQWILNNTGSGNMTIVPGDGVTINGNVALSPGALAILKRVNSNEYDLLVFSGASNGSGGGGGGGMTNPMTTAFDLIVGGSGGTPSRLAKGLNGQVLTVDGGTVGWKNPATVIESEFTASPASSYSWDGFPAGGSGGNSRPAGGGTISMGPFFDGGISPGAVLDYSGIGVAFIEDNSTSEVFLVLLLPGTTGTEVLELSGIPEHSTRTTTTATYSYNSDTGQDVFAWNLGVVGIPADWIAGGVEMAIRKFD